MANYINHWPVIRKLLVSKPTHFPKPQYFNSGEVMRKQLLLLSAVSGTIKKKYLSSESNLERQWTSLKTNVYLTYNFLEQQPYATAVLNWTIDIRILFIIIKGPFYTHPDSLGETSELCMDKYFSLQWYII